MAGGSKSRYGAARLFFDLLIFVAIVMIVIGLIMIGHGWVVSGNTIGMWSGAGLVFLGLIEIATSQVSIAILDMADDTRAMRQNVRELENHTAKPLPRSQRVEPVVSTR